MNIKDSPRLSFRLMGQNDAESLFQLDQDPEVMHFINGGNPTSMTDIHTIYLPRMKSYTNAEQGWGLWQVSEKITHKYLGWVLVRPMNFFSHSPKFNDIELGWRFFKSAWGKGYATEAAQAISTALVNNKNIDYLSAIAVEDNIGSINIMNKIGLNFVKKYLHEDPLGDAEVVLYQMAVK
ncbi:MAG: GNAT family N-acetyltransferase [Colwellia sp.]